MSNRNNMPGVNSWLLRFGVGAAIGLAIVVVATAIWGRPEVFRELMRPTPEVRLDSPQAAAGSLVRIYAAGRADLLGQVVDSATVRIQERASACSEEMRLDTECTNWLLANYKAAVHGVSRPEKCRNADLTGCACSGKGSAAADRAQPFEQTALHRALELIEMRPDRCEILNAAELSPESRDKLLGHFRSFTCNDFAPDDGFGTVTLKCGTSELQLLFRRAGRAGGWKFLLPEMTTWVQLTFSEIEQSSAQEAERRKKELSEELR